VVRTNCVKTLNELAQIETRDRLEGNTTVNVASERLTAGRSDPCSEGSSQKEEAEQAECSTPRKAVMAGSGRARPAC
jgi:hypothetical protein